MHFLQKFKNLSINFASLFSNINESIYIYIYKFFFSLYIYIYIYKLKKNFVINMPKNKSDLIEFYIVKLNVV